MQSFLGDNIHLTAQQIAQIHDQPPDIHQAAVGIKLNQQVNVALWPGCAFRH